MSSRWSYGPEGLRERPAKRWSEAELLPSWRDLQPLLIRSAGVVGIVATIMAVVSSDALHFGGEAPSGGRNDRPADLAAGNTPVVAAASELRAGGTPEPATPVEPAPPIPTKVVAVEEPAPEVAAAPELAAVPEAAVVETPAAPLMPVVADLRTGRAPGPAASTASPLTTASLSAQTAASAPAPSPAARVSEGVASDAPAIAVDDSSVEISVTALRPSDAPAGTDSPQSAWPEEAATCSRDWVAGDSADNALDCAATTELIASVAADQSPALEEAAAHHAEILAALPRVPLPRPEPPADFKPSNPHPARVSNRNSSWPPEPPPRCAAGQHAKWRFVDRRAGTKQWYCR